jgi:hypothetical protein
MGLLLLEYKAMPSLQYVDYDGWFCTFTIQQQLEISLAHSWEAPVRATRYSTEKAGGTARPSHTKSHLPVHSPPASQAGRRVGPAL